MKRSLAATTLVLCALAFGSFAATTNAQLSGAAPLVLTITPSYPRPYQTVTVVPQSSVIDLAGSAVTVSVNGAVVSRGTGSEPAYVTVGGPGTATTITVTAVANGQTYTKTVTMRPADVALIVEPLSTTHPFYEGGSLIAAEGRMRFVAVPDIRTSGGAAVSPANLVYTWRLGEQILQSSSGIGKSVLTASAPVRYRDAQVTVTVTTQDQSIVAQAAAYVSPADPLVRIYKLDPLLGPLFGTALSGTVSMSGTEESYRAVPYFFPEAPSVTWQVNGTPSDYDKDVTVRASGSGSGTAQLAVSAEAPAASQSASAALRIRFGEDRSFNFFGI